MEYNLNDVMVERDNKTVYFDNGRTIKLFKENYSKAQILNEALITARIEEDTDLAIPKLQEVCNSNNFGLVLNVTSRTRKERNHEHHLDNPQNPLIWT